MPKNLRHYLLSPLLLLILSSALIAGACRVFSATAPTPTSASPAGCAWNWAYGEGSPEFEAKLRQEFTSAGINATLSTSSYGETGGSDCSYHAMSLDMTLEVEVADTGDQAALADLAGQIDRLVRKTLDETPSAPPNLGNVLLTFISRDQGAQCRWDFAAGQCLPQ